MRLEGESIFGEEGAGSLLLECSPVELLDDDGWGCRSRSTSRRSSRCRDGRRRGHSRCARSLGTDIC